MDPYPTSEHSAALGISAHAGLPARPTCPAHEQRAPGAAAGRTASGQLRSAARPGRGLLPHAAPALPEAARGQPAERQPAAAVRPPQRAAHLPAAHAEIGMTPGRRWSPGAAGAPRLSTKSAAEPALTGRCSRAEHTRAHHRVRGARLLAVTRCARHPERRVWRKEARLELAPQPAAQGTPAAGAGGQAAAAPDLQAHVAAAAGLHDLRQRHAPRVARRAAHPGATALVHAQAPARGLGLRLSSRRTRAQRTPSQAWASREAAVPRSGAVVARASGRRAPMDLCCKQGGCQQRCSAARGPRPSQRSRVRPRRPSRARAAAPVRNAAPRPRCRPPAGPPRGAARGRAGRPSGTRAAAGRWGCGWPRPTRACSRPRGRSTRGRPRR